MTLDTSIDLKNGAFGGNYGFHFRDDKMILVDIKKNDVGEPIFQFRLQDTKTGEILDSLDVYATPGDHRWLKVVT